MSPTRTLRAQPLRVTGVDALPPEYLLQKVGKGPLCQSVFTGEYARFKRKNRQMLTKIGRQLVRKLDIEISRRMDAA